MPLPHQSNTKRKQFDLRGYKALIITTSQKTLDKVDPKTGVVIKKGKATGVYAAEMTEPYYTFLEANMEVDLASIRGGQIPIDPLSLKPIVRTSYDTRFLHDPVFKEKAAHSIPLKEIRIADYAIVFLSGGWGAAYDFAQSKLLADKITEAYASEKVLGAVCHGPLGFVSALKPDGSPLVKGVQMTGVTNRQLKQLMVQGTPKHPEAELRKAKAVYQSKSGLVDMFNTLVVVDKTHQIVTGQNQKAGVEAAQEAIELLLKKITAVSPISFRKPHMDELKTLQTLFVDTIKSVCHKDYTPDQIKAWTASIENPQRWNDLLNDQYVLVAEKNNTIVGFASLNEKDYIDFFYIHKDYQRQGIAKQLYEKIETEARLRGATILLSDISITAKPFFESRGFCAIRKQNNEVRGAVLVNYKMTKPLIT